MDVKLIDRVEIAGVPDNVLKVEYISGKDGLGDWAYVLPNVCTDIWIVNIHGHGSTGDQLYTRKDIRNFWLPKFLKYGLSILTPNLRGNAWMSPCAADDLHDLIEFLKLKYDAKKFIFYGGSMGGTSNLIYAILHPHDVNAVVSLGAATDLTSYWQWCKKQQMPILLEIACAISYSYGGRPEDVPEIYGLHSVLHNTKNLSMPVYISHGIKDAIIPVDQVRQIKGKLKFNKNFLYNEIEGGDHDSPIYDDKALDWIMAVFART